MSGAEGVVRFERRDAIAIITFDRPSAERDDVAHVPAAR
jgi:hypothetical protein